MSESDVNGVKDWHSSKHIRKRARHLLEHPDEEIPSDVTFFVGDGENEPRKMFKRASEPKKKKAPKKEPVKRGSSPPDSDTSQRKSAEGNPTGNGQGTPSPTDSDPEDDEDWDVGEGSGRKSRGSVENGSQRKPAKGKSKVPKGKNSQPGSPVKKPPAKKAPVKPVGKNSFESNKNATNFSHEAEAAAYVTGNSRDDGRLIDNADALDTVVKPSADTIGQLLDNAARAARESSIDACEPVISARALFIRTPGAVEHITELLNLASTRNLAAQRYHEIAATEIAAALAAITGRQVRSCNLTPAT